VREQWLLAVPTFLLCRDDCKGLCPTCGVDLNAGECQCPPQITVDSRWDALRAVAISQDADVPVQHTKQQRRSSGKSR
jgi:uncharacterized protein